MKKETITTWTIALLTGIFAGCGSGKDSQPTAERTDSLVNEDSAIAMCNVGQAGRTYNVADINDSMQVYTQEVKRELCFMVISKREFRLYVYEARPEQHDTILAAHFPVCYARYPEAKTKSGDMRTPESTMQQPFTIQQIQNATDWHHDFGDGRGSIRSYGDWFLRLETPGFTGVGIHGSTNNEASVPGRDSEGCIRLRDNDLNVLHDRFAEVGQKVIIKGANEKKLPFELKAQQALGARYRAARVGNPLSGQTATDTKPSVSSAATDTLSTSENVTSGSGERTVVME